MRLSAAVPQNTIRITIATPSTYHEHIQLVIYSHICSHESDSRAPHANYWHLQATHWLVSFPFFCYPLCILPQKTNTDSLPHCRYINGKWVEGVDKKKFEVINPSTEEVITSVCEGTEKDVDAAVEAARKAFEGEWKKTSSNKRSRLLLKLADLLEANTDLLAAVESLDNGKSINMARGDVGSVVNCIRYYGGWADKIEGKTHDIDPDMFHYSIPEPVSQLGGHCILQMNTNNHIRLVFVAKSFPGTSLCSCGHGRLALPWPPATPSS